VSRKNSRAPLLIRAAWLGVGFLFAGACAALGPELIYQLASRSVVAVQAVDSASQIMARGSSVVMHKDLWVTNCHVIARGKTFYVRYAKKRLPARLVAYDAMHDLCALEARDQGAQPARIGDTKGLRVGHRSTS
jgi:serine protease Do